MQSKAVRRLEDQFREAFQREPAGNAAHKAAMKLYNLAIAHDTRIDATLFKKLAYVSFTKAFESDHDPIGVHNKGLALVYKPTCIAKDYGAYIVATAEAFGFTRVHECGSRDLYDYLNARDGVIVNFKNAIISTPDMCFGMAINHNFAYNHVRRDEMLATAMLLYRSMIVWTILIALMDPDNDYEIPDHMRAKVRSFLACMGIVESYKCIGGEDAHPWVIVNDEDKPCLVDAISCYGAVEHGQGRYWAFRHASARFIRARMAAQLIQRRWRTYMRVRSNVRHLHMINKYSPNVAVLPSQITRTIAVLSSK
jgi:hypothetical protein